MALAPCTGGSNAPNKKTKRLLNIPKLEDANLAGGRDGSCLSEAVFSRLKRPRMHFDPHRGRPNSHRKLGKMQGDSAKSLAVAGLGVIGRDRYGVFPLRGKILNVAWTAWTLSLWPFSFGGEGCHICSDYEQCRDRQHHQDHWPGVPRPIRFSPEFRGPRRTITP